MSKKLYVGNLSFDTSENDLNTLFAGVGAVESVRIITDRDTGRSRGFGFVEMNEKAGAEAISRLNGAELAGRQLTVNEARPQAERNGGGGDRSRQGSRY